MRRFLEEIYGGSVGFLDIVTLDPHTGAPTSERWLSWPNDKTFAERYVNLREDEDVYISVALFNDKQRTDRDLNARVRAVWADADTCRPDQFRVKPSITVQTSPGRWHVWWVLDREAPAREASQIARKVAYAHQEQGCDLGFHVSKILRVPGTTNNKYKEPYTVKAEYTGTTYTLEELNNAYADVELDREIEFSADVPAPITGDDLRELENKLEQWDLIDLYLHKPDPGQSWSERMFRLEIELFRNGMNADEVFSIMLNAPINKYNQTDGVTQTGVPLPRRPHPEQDLWRDVQRARAEAEEYSNEAPSVSKEDLPPVSLLSLSERELLRDNPTFPDLYTSWALTRSPDSPAIYHRALSWQILASCLGDRAYVDLRWGKMYLNLWTFILGETTRYRKSTSMGFATEVIEQVDTGSMTESTYIGSDATSEALTKTLGAREGKSSLVHIDEINEFFAEVFTKGYRAGTLGMFTKIYDGRVPVVLRASKDAGNSKHERAVLNFLGGGIQSKLSQILHREHFESGFLLRTTWAAAEPIFYTEGSSDVMLRDSGMLSVADDPTLKKFVRNIVHVKSKHSDDNPTEIELSEEALVRINKMVHDMHAYAHRIGDSVVEAGIDRLRDSILKAAALLTLLMDEKEISEFLMLRAILQGEEWFIGLIKMVSEVSTSGFGRQLDEIVTYIASGKGQMRTEGEIYRKFSFRPHEYREIVDSLRLSGRIRREAGDDRKWKALI